MPQTALQEDLSFLLDLQEQGISLRAEDDTLVCDAAPGALTETMGTYIRQNKGRLLALLRSMTRGGSLPRIVPDPEHAHEPFPLTENQEAYWLGRSDKLESGGVGIHTFFELLFENFDAPRFEAAWNAVVRSHAMLRAVLLPEGRQKVLAETPPVRIEEEHLAPDDRQGAEAALEQARQDISHARYDLFHWPQFRMKVFHLPQDGGAPPQSVLMASIDMWCLDLRSLQIILDHLADLYLGQVPAPLPEPGFRDYLVALQKLHQSPAYDRALTYWRERIRTLPMAPALPVRPQSEARTGHFTRRAHRFPREQWQRIRALIRQKGLTTPSVLLACYASVISRWSETKRFTLNIPRYNRLPLHEDIDDIVGEFASFSLLEVDNSARLPFEELARTIQRRMWADLDYAHVSGVRVLREWRQSLASPPAVLAPYVFTSEPEHSARAASGPGAAGARGSLSWIGALERIGTVRHMVTQTPQVWLDSQFSEIRDELYVSWDSIDGVFAAGVPGRMFEAYCALIAELDRETTWSRAEIPLPAGEDALRKVLTGPREALPDQTPWRMLRQHARNRPQDVALADDQGAMNWAEVLEEVTLWADRLRALGQGRAVAFALPKGRRQFLAAMAIHAFGGVIVPLDHESPQARIATILADSRAAVLLTDAATRQRLCDLPCPVIDMDAPQAPPLPENPPRRHDTPLYCIIYTSGSTGVPKGVMMPLAGLLNMAHDAAKRFGLGPRDALLTLSPAYHDMALFDMMSAALLGVTLVFPSPDRLKDPGHWLERIRERGVTLWNTVPATMTMLLDYLESTPASRRELPTLRYACLGGDWIPLDTPNRLKKIAPNATVVSVGGPTEISVWNLLYPVERFDPRWRSIPYGYPIRNTAYHLLDARLEDCPAMVVGEMYCSGTGLTQGYLNDAEKTEKAFFTHPTRNIRMFRTGDLGRLHEDGYIEFIGRRDNQVNINGYRIELGEIETAMGLHPSVTQAVAVTGSRPGSGGGLLLWVTLKPGRQCPPRELRAFLKRHVPKYMLPSAIGLAEAFPLTQNNKIDRRSIAAWPPPRQEKTASEAQPTTPTERRLARAWEELLGLEKPGRDQNFFEVGGNSIAAVRLYNQVMAGKYSGLSVASIFSHPTIGDLAAAIDAAPCLDDGGERDGAGLARPATPAGAAAVSWPPVAPVPRRLPLVPATRVQQRMFYEERRQRNKCFNLCLDLAIGTANGDALDPGRIETACNAVVARHEILRTNFQEVPDANNADMRHVVQRIIPERRIGIEVLECSGHPTPRQAVHSFGKEFTLRPYDLEDGPLLRLALVLEGPTHGHLLIGFHHMVMDGWSLTPLLQDLAAALDGDTPPPPPIQQADLALWENTQAFAEAAGALLPHAARRIPADGTPSVIIDAVSLNDTAPTDDADECFVEEYIPQHVVERIAELSERNASTPFAVMCTVFGLLVADYNRSDTAQFGTYVAVRALPGLEQALGSMTAPAPLVLRFDRGRTLVDAARDTMRQLSESIDISLLPFEDLVRAVAPARLGDELPLFGMALAYDNTPAHPVAAGGMELRPLGMRQYRTSIDLEASVSVDSAGTRIMMLYNPAKLRRAPVRDFMHRFIHMLAQAADDPALPLGALSPMADRDARLRREWSRPQPICPARENLLEYFYAVEREAPDFTALIETESTPDGPRATAACTLAELRRLADGMTAALLDQGVAPGQRIALLMPRSIRLVAAMLAAQQCGAVFTLLPLTLAAERARDILDASEAVLVCHTAEALRHPALQGRRALDLGTVSPPAPDALAALRASGRIVSPGADADLCLFFTSGSQGRPKGVRLSHANWINRLEGDWHALPYAEGEACISKALTGFIDAFCEIFQPLLKKVPVYILPEGEEADVEALAEHLGHWKITRAMLVVSLMQGLLDVLRARGGRLGALRHIMSSGERLPAGVVGAFSRLLPRCTLHNYYGSTEVAADVVRCAVAPPGGEHDRRVVPLGGPMANMRIEIMSPARTPLPHGMPGEIAIAGPSVSPGYLDPETSGFFEHDGVRFFAPGDLGMWTENGELLGFGRRDRQIKIRGQRVEPGDIEQSMLRHPQIAQAAAFSLGDGADMTLAACVVLREPGAIPTDTLRRDFRRSLSGAMMPSLLLEVPALPRTASGKVDFIALRKTILQQAQEPTAPEAAPQTATEEAMAALWRRLLGHPIPHRQSDFFACGGHSLLAIRLIAAIRERFHAPLRAKDIFDTPVFADLCELVDLLAAHSGQQTSDITETMEVL
jgi:amino acid adenylation domain-containing protein